LWSYYFAEFTLERSEGLSTWFLGFTLAALSIEISYKSMTWATLFVPVLALGLPIIDITFAIIRRLLRYQPIFSADQGHIHYKLLHACLCVARRQAGFTVRQAALTDC